MGSEQPKVMALNNRFPGLLLRGREGSTSGETREARTMVSFFLLVHQDDSVSHMWELEWKGKPWKTARFCLGVDRNARKSY